MLLRKISFTPQFISPRNHPFTKWARQLPHTRHGTPVAVESPLKSPEHTQDCDYGYKYKVLHSPQPPNLTLFVRTTLAGSRGQGQKNILTSWCFDRFERGTWRKLAGRACIFTVAALRVLLTDEAILTQVFSFSRKF